MKRMIGIVLVLMLATGSICMTQDVNAKRITKKGIYYNTAKNLKVKIKKHKLVFKGKMGYCKKLFGSYNKKLRKGKKTFKLDKNIKYYVDSPAGPEKISLKESKYRMRTICKTYIATFYLYVKNRKVYKILYTVC